MTVILESMDTAFTPGFNTNFVEKNNDKRYLEWYDSKYNSLLPAPTIANGRKLYTLGHDLGLPLFKLASDFIADAVLNDLPTTTGSDEFVAEYMPMIDKALRRGTRYWSILDRGVWTAEPGMMRAVNPQFYYRVGEPEQKDALVGHIIAYPYRERTASEQLLPAANLIANRIRVTKIVQGRAIVQTFMYTENSVVGQPVTGPEVSPITEVCTAGEGDSWYGGVKDLASQIIIEYTNSLQDINRFRNRTRFMPVSVANEIRNSLTMAGRQATLTQITNLWEDLIRPVVGLVEDDMKPESQRDVLDLSATFESFRSQLDLFFMASGVPPSSFGIGIGRGESGVAREKAEDAAAARARAYRRDLMECLPRMARAMGSTEELSFQWITSPFEKASEKLEEIMTLLAAGIISVEEARSALGWRGDPPTQQNDLQRMTEQLMRGEENAQ